MFGIHGRTFARREVVTAARRPALGRRALICTFATAGLLALSGNALAASGTPINVGTPFSNDPPVVAVDSAGTAYVAWANTKDLSPVTTNIVQYCVLPAGATACTHTGSLTPADGLQYVDKVQVLVDGTTVVILADVYGNTPGNLNYTPVQEWQSTDGGATFTIVNGGLSVASGIIGAITTGPIGALILPGTNVLGFGWDTAAGPPTFNAFPLTSPPECSRAACPTGYATLEPPTNPDTLGNPAGQFASQLGANPGVMGIFEANFTNGPFGCSNAQAVPFSTVYAYGSGDQSPTNDYNLSPGTQNSAWKVALSQADCNSDYAAVAGGPSGFGILNRNELTQTTQYLKFDQANMSFDLPPVTVAPNGEQSAALSQDGSGGIYATYLYSGPGAPIAVAYSGNAGASWTYNTLNPNTDQGAANVTSSVGSTGQGWATWTDNGSVFAQQFVASDATPSPAADTITTSQTAGPASGPSITVPAGTIGETDRATVTGANATSATGTMTFGLFSKSSCAASSQVFNGGTSAVTGGVAFSPGVAKVLAPGTYYWQALYSGNATNVPAASACGSEVLTIVPAASIGGGATSNGSTVTITVSCVSTPCTVTVTITFVQTSHTTRAVSAKNKTVTIATGTFTINKAGKQKLAVKLTKAGKTLLKKKHGHLKAKALVSTKVDGQVQKVSKTIHITTKKH